MSIRRIQSLRASRQMTPRYGLIESLERREFLSADPNWAVSFGGAGEDEGRAVASDANGFVYVAASRTDWLPLPNMIRRAPFKLGKYD